jgi:glutathione synthase
LKILFLIDPIAKLNTAFDTSIKLAFDFESLGHEVWMTTPSAMTLKYMGKKLLLADCQKFEFRGHSHFENLTQGPLESKPLSEFDLILIRVEPPFDQSYLEMLWLVQSHASTRTQIWNAPKAIASLNEKILALDFEQQSVATLISNQQSDIAQFCKQFDDVVIKPLNLYGGRGVIKVNTSSKNFTDIIQLETKNFTEKKVFQKYEASITKGEVRAFTVAGHATSWCLKVPASGDFLANTRAGSKLQHYIPSSNEILRVETIAKSLLERGIVFCGFDIIGELISEINITCPALLHPDRDSLEGVRESSKKLLMFVEGAKQTL